MAWIKCCKCGRRISDKNDICPKCGYDKTRVKNNIWKKHIFGIFNILLILGVSSTIAPIRFEFNTIVDAAIMLLSVVMIFIFALKSSKITRTQGAILIVVYALYLAFIILRNVNPELFMF